MADAEYAKFELLAQKVHPGCRLLHLWSLKGGVSALVTALEIARPDGLTQKMIVRRHGPADLLRNPRLAVDEFKLLQILQAAELPAPVPYYVDEPGQIFSTPCLVVEYIEGEPESAPRDMSFHTLQLASHLSKIHTVASTGVDLSFLPDQEALWLQIDR